MNEFWLYCLRKLKKNNTTKPTTADAARAAEAPATQGSVAKRSNFAQTLKAKLKSTKTDVKDPEHNIIILSVAQQNDMLERAIPQSDSAEKNLDKFIKIFDEPSNIKDNVLKRIADNNQSRLEKQSDIPLSRTGTFAINSHGEKFLIAMQNQKSSTYDPNKDKNYTQAFRGKGAEKIVKNCVSLTTGEILVRARMNASESNIDELIITMKTFRDAKYLVTPICISAPFMRKKEPSIYVFYPPAVCSLRDILTVDSKSSSSETSNLQKLFSNDQLEAYDNLKAGKHDAIPDFIIKIMEDIAQGLKEIHDAGLTHQDIKPDNILLFKNSDGTITAKITDFGLTVENSNIDNPHSTIHTAAPEVFMYNNDKYYKNPKFYSYGKSLLNPTLNDKIDIKTLETPKRDIFSAGVVFKSLLSGIPPNDSRGQYKIPKHEFIKDMLAYQPKDRPDAATLINSLQALRSPAKRTHKQ